MRILYFNTDFKKHSCTIRWFSIIILLYSLLFPSCFIAKPSYIFKDIKKDTLINHTSAADTQLKIIKYDVLNISISSLNPLEDVIFNSITSSLAPGSKDAVANAGYVVNDEGNIYLHKLGKILVAGSTRKEIKLQLEQALSPFLKDPIVTVNFGNHFITVLGETGSSQIINMPQEKISLIDAIALSGNTSPTANFKNVMVIRETAHSKEFKQLNLENKSIFTSPWYYLLPKDILVIKPDEENMVGEQKKTRNMLFYTTFLSGISFLVLILDRLLRR